MKKTLTEWRAFDIVESGDTLQTCWTDTKILYLVVRVGGDLYYITHTEHDLGGQLLEGHVVTRSTAPVWRYVSGDVALLAAETPWTVAEPSQETSATCYVCRATSNFPLQVGWVAVRRNGVVVDYCPQCAGTHDD